MLESLLHMILVFQVATSLNANFGSKITCSSNNTACDQHGDGFLVELFELTQIKQSYRVFNKKGEKVLDYCTPKNGSFGAWDMFKQSESKGHLTIFLKFHEISIKTLTQRHHLKSSKQVKIHGFSSEFKHFQPKRCIFFGFEI